MKTIKFIFSNFLLLSILFFSNCSPDDTPNPNKFELSLLSYADNYNTLELVALLSNQALSYETYSGTFGANNIELSKGGSNSLLFIIPDVAPGNYTLTINGFEQQFQFKVNKTVLTQSPDDVITELTDMGMANIDYMIRNTDSLINVGVITNSDPLINELKLAKDSANAALARFSKLNETKKAEVALFIVANMAAFNEFETIMNGVYEDGSFKKGWCDGDQWKKATCLIGEMALGVAKMSAPAIAGGLIGGAYSGGMAATGGAILGTFIFRNLIVIPAMNKVKNAWTQLSNISFIPADDLMADVQALKKSIAFSSGVPKKLTFSFNVRNIQAQDSDNGDYSSVGILLTTYNEIANSLNYSSIGFAGQRTSRMNIDDMSSAQLSMSGGAISGKLDIDKKEAYMVVTNESAENIDFTFTISVTYGNSTITSDPIDAQVSRAELGDVEMTFNSSTLTLSYSADDYPYSMDKYSVTFEGKLKLTGNTPPFSLLQIKAKADKNWYGNMQTAPFNINYNPIDSTFQIPIQMSILDDFSNGMVKTIKLFTKDPTNPLIEENANYFYPSEIQITFSEN